MSVTIYSKKNCPACEKAKALLNKLDIPFETAQIDTDIDAMDFIAMQGHRSVPQIYRDGKLAIEGGYAGMDKLTEEEIVRVLTK